MKLQRLFVMAVGAVLVLFGLACVNYTKPSALEHHRQWAAEHDAPAPSDAIQIGGVLSTVAGAGLIGLGVSRWRGPSAGSGASS